MLSDFFEYKDSCVPISIFQYINLVNKMKQITV